MDSTIKRFGGLSVGDAIRLNRLAEELIKESEVENG